VFGELVDNENAFFATITDRVPVSELARFQTDHSTLIPDIKALLSKKVEKTTKEALVEARVGQGRFRAALLTIWNGRCAVTGCNVSDAIRASHIKPWRMSTDNERLDPMNGLPLVATFDALFDAGLISFAESGEMLVSNHLPASEQVILGVVGKRLVTQPAARTAEYLSYHRAEVFCGGHAAD